MSIIKLLGVVALALLGACASRPAPIQHVVLAQLKDPAETSALLADSDKSLAHIPGVASYTSGTHLDIGRSGIDSNCSAALVIGFDSVEDYRGYLDHPAHIALVERWKPKTEWLRIYDIAR